MCRDDHTHTRTCTRKHAHAQASRTCTHQVCTDDLDSAIEVALSQTHSHQHTHTHHQVYKDDLDSAIEVCSYVKDEHDGTHLDDRWEGVDQRGDDDLHARVAVEEAEGPKHTKDAQRCDGRDEEARRRKRTMSGVATGPSMLSLAEQQPD